MAYSWEHQAHSFTRKRPEVLALYYPPSIEQTGSTLVPGYAEVAEWQTRCVQGAVSLADVGVQISPSAPQPNSSQFLYLLKHL